MKNTFSFKLFLFISLLFSAFSGANAQKINTLIITGQNNHNWQVSHVALKQILQNSDLFSVDIAVSPEQGKDMSSFIIDFTPYRLVVIDYNGDSWPQQTNEAFLDFVRNGGGVVIYHAGNNTFPTWKEFNEITALGGWGNRNEKAGPYVYWKDGELVKDPTPGHGGEHGAAHAFVLTARNETHPIVQGFPQQWKHAKDELYGKMRGPGNIEDLLYTAYSDSAGGGTGREEPLLFTVNYGKGRIFHTMLGHAGKTLDDNISMQCTGFQVTLLRGSEWAATGKVTQSVPPDFPKVDAISLRPKYRIELVSTRKFENLGKTPQMGWNSWNTFAVNIEEKLIKDMADLFVDLGLKEAGYEYILLDDGWMDMQRDAQGNLVPHPEKFPNGMKVVADYVHSKGLKFGLYNCAGNKTCAGYPGSRGHEYQDALKYAEWGVDYLKYDWCDTGELNAKEAYTTMRDALYAAGRPVFFSMCEWGTAKPWEWAQNIGHSWRTTGDIYACFDCIKDYGSWQAWGAVQILNLHDNNVLRKSAGPGHWNDMDMLEVGNGDLAFHENQTHFTLWAILNSPLILGNDLRNINQETLQILKNKDIIALSQDASGIQGFKYTAIGNVEIWVKPLANNEWGICFFNHSGDTAAFVFDWNKQIIKDEVFGYEVAFSKDNIYKIRDLYLGKEIGNTVKPLKITLAKNQSFVVRVYK